MPMDKACYPKDWKTLRAAVLQRAKNSCECTGECGATHEGDHCEAPNGVLIQRTRGELQTWVKAYSSGASARHWAPIKIVLTTAHLCQDSTCNDLEHLRALCQCCHLRLDVRQHTQSAKKTREKKKERAA